MLPKPQQPELFELNENPSIEGWNPQIRHVTFAELAEVALRSIEGENHGFAHHEAPVWEERYRSYWENPEDNLRMVAFMGLVDDADRWLSSDGQFMTHKYFEKKDDGYWDCYAVEHRIPLSWAVELIRDAENKARLEIETIIRKQVERGITEGVARAIQESTATLQQVQTEKQRIQDQIKRLEAEKARMEAIEARLAAREAEKAARKTQPRDTKGYVYLLKNLHEADVYKIGMTTDPTTRIRKFEIVLPFPVECDCLIATSDRIALENELHTKFADKRIDGEWFRLTPEDVEYIRSLAKESQEQ